MLFIFSTPVFIRHLWQLKTLVFLHRCLIRAVPFFFKPASLMRNLTNVEKNHETVLLMVRCLKVSKQFARPALLPKKLDHSLNFFIPGQTL